MSVLIVAALALVVMSPAERIASMQFRLLLASL